MIDNPRDSFILLLILYASWLVKKSFVNTELIRRRYLVLPEVIIYWKLFCCVLVTIILPLCSAHQKMILVIDDHVGISIIIIILFCGVLVTIILPLCSAHQKKIFSAPWSDYLLTIILLCAGYNNPSFVFSPSEEDSGNLWPSGHLQYYY